MNYCISWIFFMKGLKKGKKITLTTAFLPFAFCLENQNRKRFAVLIIFFRSDYKMSGFELKWILLIRTSVKQQNKSSFIKGSLIKIYIPFCLKQFFVKVHWNNSSYGFLDATVKRGKKINLHPHSCNKFP